MSMHKHKKNIFLVFALQHKAPDAVCMHMHTQYAHPLYYGIADTG